MKVHEVRSVSGYLETVSKIAKKAPDSGIVWFRGISDWHYSLIPSLYREKELFYYEREKCGYTSIHYAEDMRTQHYIAKNYHFYDKLPASRVEWLEVMQHHQAKTRVLDWSESSIHSLLFAVEPFIDTNKYPIEVRKKQMPCVWVLHPQKLNQMIFLYLLDHSDFWEKLMRTEMELSDDEVTELRRRMDSFKKLNVKADNWESMKRLNNIVNLSAINDEVLRDRSRLKEMLCHGEMLLVFYLLSRIYSDGYLLSERDLQPLAVVQAYHSMRIKEQKGVFTVFPVYQEQENDCYLRRAGFDPNGMQYMQGADEWLERIDLRNPGKIAKELLQNGVRDSWLYPENPIVANEIENCNLT